MLLIICNLVQKEVILWITKNLNEIIGLSFVFQQGIWVLMAYMQTLTLI